MQLVKTLDKDIAIQIMKNRGFSLVSSISRLTKETGSDNTYISVPHPQLCFAKDTDLNVHFHATVDIDRSDITLEMVQLKMLVSLNISRFDFFHPLFEDFEKKLYTYAKACLEVDKTVETYKGGIKPELSYLLPELTEEQLKESKPKKEKKTIEERKKEFWNDLKPIAKQKGLTKAFAEKFFNYWTEHGPNDKTFRKEREKVFDISRRFDTFIDNEKKWNKESKTQTEKKAEQQDEQRKKTIKVIDKNKLFQ